MSKFSGYADGLMVDQYLACKATHPTVKGGPRIVLTARINGAIVMRRDVKLSTHTALQVAESAITFTRLAHSRFLPVVRNDIVSRCESVLL